MTLSAIHLCNVLPPETLQQVRAGLLYAREHFPKGEEYRWVRLDIERGLHTVQAIEDFRNEQNRRMDNAEKAASEIIKRIFK